VGFSSRKIHLADTYHGHVYSDFSLDVKFRKACGGFAGIAGWLLLEEEATSHPAFGV
jgi:hypothetical protein